MTAQPVFAPRAAEAAMVRAPGVRFTIITDRLFRLEYSMDDQFEDRPSQIFWQRKRPVPDYNISRSQDELIVQTSFLTLTYRLSQPFSPQSLQIRLEDGRLWRYEDDDPENLLGTYRTLDRVSGSTPLENGLLSRAGWSLVDDSHSLVFNDAGWLEGRSQGPQYRDLYFFGYGRDYRACLRDFGNVAGKPPLLPRWALGNWWSRYWAYSQEELSGLMRDFRTREVPLSVCIIDMDWHVTDVDYDDTKWPRTTIGWTGYTWNRELFPRPEKFLEWLHEQGLKTALNLHPADGVWPHEEAYAVLARRVGIDPATQQPVPFHIADPEFTGAYLEELHHPLEEQGVDFWWIDWQQGELSTLPGLDPLWWLNHVHFYDLGRGEKRPFIFSRWGGLGNHRYPIGFSGDTHVNWETLAFLPYFTATAANVGYGWWSHDIGGHMMGTETPELYARWVQFGVFSPILRLHSTNNPFHERRPWGYPDNVFRITRDAMQLRHALIPYLYTMSWLDHQHNLPPLRPLYHDFPELEAAYYCPQQYLFGTELIAAPYTAPADPDTTLSRQVVWLPPGDWYHFFTGAHYAGNGWHAVYGTLVDVPLFARAGAIVPLGPRRGWGGVSNPETIDIHIFAGADRRFLLYEDDGETQSYAHGEYGTTEFRQIWRENELLVTVQVDPEQQGFVPERRHYRFHIHGIVQPDQVMLQIGEMPADSWTFTYDAEQETLLITADGVPTRAHLELKLQTGSSTLLSQRDRTQETLLAMLTGFRLDTLTKMFLAQRLGELRAAPELLGEYELALSESQARALLEVSQQAGIHHVTNTRWPHLLVYWNNREDEAVQYRFTEMDDFVWAEAARYREESGQLPRFKAILPEKRWQGTVIYPGRNITIRPDKT